MLTLIIFITLFQPQIYFLILTAPLGVYYIHIYHVWTAHHRFNTEKQEFYFAEHEFLMALWFLSTVALMGLDAGEFVAVLI